MYKQLFVAIFLVSPLLWGVFVGYPVQKTTYFTQSKRCYDVGDWGKYVSCIKTQDRLSGISFLQSIFYKITAFYAGFGPVLIVLFLVNFFLSIRIIFRL